MPLSKFREKLENDLKKSVKLTLNNNRSTMLSVKWEPECTKVSIHRFFIDAPENIMDSLACYIKQEQRNICPSIKSFIEDNMRKLDYSHQLDHLQMDAAGKIYNLKALFDQINKDYFENRLHLNITWFGKKQQKCRSQITFGLYHEPLKLIKINRLLDSFDFPEYFVSYVIYHEILHHVCPSYYDESGKHRIHNKEFKKKELEFRHYRTAQEWLKNNREKLFAKVR